MSIETSTVRCTCSPSRGFKCQRCWGERNDYYVAGDKEYRARRAPTIDEQYESERDTRAVVDRLFNTFDFGDL